MRSGGPLHATFDGGPMGIFTCSQCHRAVAPSASSAPLTCSHCQGPVDSAGEKPSRWFVAHHNEKSGPYSWRALLALASRGDLDPEAMLIKDQSARWVRARTLRALFNSAPARTADGAAPPAVPFEQPHRIQPSPRSAAAVARPKAAEVPRLPEPHARRDALDLEFPAPRVPARKPTELKPAPPADALRSIWRAPWIMEGLAAASISLLVGLSIVLGYHMFGQMSPRDPRPTSPEQRVASPATDESR